MSPKKTVVLLVILLSASTMLGCLKNEEAKKVNLSNRIDLGSNPDPKSLKIGVAAIISPEETLIYYQEMLDYLSEKMGVPIKLVQAKNYQEMNDLIRRNFVDAAFICSGAYIEGHDQFDMELLLVPVVRGEPYYYSYIIVPRESHTTSFEELKGKIFAYTDPISNTGKMVPQYMIAQMGEDPESFFRNTIFTLSHDKSIKAVADGMVDGAAVDSLVWDYLNATEPGITSRTRSISKSQPFGIPPMVVSKEIDPDLKERLRTTLLQMHEDEKGREILDKIMIDRFSEANDSLYDSIREMKNVVLSANAKR